MGKVKKNSLQERPGVGVYVKDLSSITVSSADHMERIMKFGNNNRCDIWLDIIAIRCIVSCFFCASLQNSFC